MRNIAVLPRLLALFGAVMFVGAGAQASNVDAKAGISAKSTQSYLLAEDNQQEKEDSGSDSNDSNDE